MLDLRPYQIDAIEGIEQAEREGTRRPLVVHPTGTGKTVTFAELAKRRSNRGRTLALVHREELANQAAEKLGWQAPELNTGIVKAELDELGADVVIGSVPTLARDNRLARLLESARRSPFGTVIVDEAHHAPAPSWVKIMTAMGSYSQYGPITAGFTATPERDKKSLSVWEKVVSYMSIQEAIFQGYLVDIPPAQTVQTSVDLGKVGKGSNGDYSEGDLGEALEAAGAIEQIADAYVKYAKNRKGVAFTPTVRTAHDLAAALRERGIPAEAVDGETPKELRKAILARLKTGETQVVCNCGVLTEGFDETSISCVVIARPTKFHGLYVQMVGRGTRTHPGKTDLLVLDVVGASERHELITWVDLGLTPEGKRKKPTEPGEGLACPSCEDTECNLEHHRCALCSRYLPRRLVLDGVYQHETCVASKTGTVDVFGSSRLRWLPVGDAWCLGSEKEVIVMVPAGTDTWKLATYENGRIKVLHEQIPVNWAQGIGEDRCKAFLKLAERDARWLAGPVSTLQQSRLLREGLPQAKLGKVRTRGDAADLITRIQGRRAVKKLVGV